MTRRTEELLREALRLDLNERADLAARLVASMDGEPDTDVEAAWIAEIARREARAHAGETAFEDWETVRAELERKYPKRSAE